MHAWRFSIFSSRSPQAGDPCLTCHFLVWQLRARQRNESRRSEAEREGGGMRGEFEEIKTKWYRWAKKVAFQKKKKRRNVTRTRPSLLTSVLLFRGQVLPSKGTWEKKKKGLPRCFTWHLCTCICRGGRWGGGGRQRQSVRWGWSPKATRFCCYTTSQQTPLLLPAPLPPPDTSPWNECPAIESATRAFIFSFLQLVRCIYLWQLKRKKKSLYFLLFCRSSFCLYRRWRAFSLAHVTLNRRVHLSSQNLRVVEFLLLISVWTTFRIQLCSSPCSHDDGFFLIPVM